MALQKVDLTTPQPGGKVGEPTKQAWRKFNENVDETAALVEAAGAGGQAAAAQVAALEEALGDAAYAPAASFATALQGAKADTAAQPSDLVDQAGKHISGFRSANLGEAHRAAPMCVSLARSTAFSLSNNNPSDPLVWGVRVVDTALHWSSDNPTRITIPAGASGLWRLRATIEFPAHATGHREVIIRRGGTTIMARVCVPAIDHVGRSQVVQVETGPIPAVQGNYFEVLYYQSSGITLQGIAAGTKFQAERVGDYRGRWEGVLFSADYSYRSDWSKYVGTGGTVIEPTGLLVTADPVNPSLLAGRIRTKKNNNSVQYPRVQAQTASFIARDANIYVALSIYVPADTYARLLPVDHGINLHEIYGPPFGTRSPNLLQFHPVHGLCINAWIDGAPKRIWTLPPEKCVGRWVDIVHRVQLSADPAVGYHELYANIGDGNGRVQQTLSDGVTSGLRFYLATVLPGVNDGGNNFSSLKVSWDGTSSLEEATIFFGEHRVGQDLFVTTDRSEFSAAY